MKMNKAKERWESALQNNYGLPSIALSHGKGSYVWDVEGNKYLDMLGGIATTVVGQSNPKVVAAVSKQIGQLSHVSNFYIHEPGLRLAERLKSFTGEKDARIFFCNSGAEANEAALKLSRKTGRKKVVSTIGGFHGRTLGALSLTGQPEKRDLFAPIIEKIKYVPFGDVAAMSKAVNQKTAMVIVEPIQGENGVITPPAGYLKALREICDANGALLVIDAVQTGMGRTGFWFGYEHEEITPDVITLAKGLGGGLPLGAMIAIGPASHLLKPGEHGSTFGGNPVSCAAGLAVINEIEKKALNERALELGEFLKSELLKIEGVQDVRGRGLLLGIVLEQEWAKEIANYLMAKGVLVNAPNSNTIRIAPPLIVTKTECAKFVKIFAEVIANG